MAEEIIDVITRLTYDVNNSALTKDYDLLIKHIKAIDDNSKSITELEQKRAKTDSANLERLKQIGQQIDKLKLKNLDLVNSIKSHVKENEALARSLGDNVKLFDQMVKSRGFFISQQEKLTQVTQKAGTALINFNRVVQDAPYGIIGIANNIDPLVLSFQQLQKETGSSAGAFKAMLAGLTGGAGLALGVSVVTSLLIAFGDKIFDSGDQAEKAAEKQKKHTDSIKALNKELVDAIKNQSDLDKINDDRQNKGAAAAKREIDDLKARGAAEEEIFNKEQEARQREEKELQNRVNLFEQVKNEVNDLQDQARHLSSSLIQAGVTPESFIADRINQIATEMLGLSQEQANNLAQNISKSFANRTAIIELIENEQIKLNESIKEKSAEIGQATEVRRKKLLEDEVKDFDESYTDALAAVERDAQLKLLYDEHLQLIDSQIATEQEILKLRQESRLNQGVNVSKEQLEAEKKTAEFEIKRLEFFRQMTALSLEIAKEKEKIALAEKKGSEQDRIIAQLRINELISQREGLFAQRPQDLMNGVNPSYLDGFNRQDLIDSRAGGTKADPRTDAQKLKRPDFELKIQEDQFKKEEDAYKKHLREVVKVYQSFEQAVSQILNDISKRQIEALDREVDVRTERVRQAEKLAERGNTEILRLETERLDSAEKLRRESAQRQIAINNALALSNAILAVATTATTGPASIALIPAVLAALVAGYSFVRSLDTSVGFKDGVIDLQGPGNERSDSIPARLSKGESVMTAQATKRYKPLLEAMNDGRLPYTATRNNDYATPSIKKDLHAIREAIEGNKVNVKQSMDQYGIAQSVETAQRREARKWRS